MTIGDAQDLIHGTTQAINTLIERKGAKTALLVTQGTRDFYKIGRGNRPESYNLMFKRHTPLVSRQLTFEVEERLLADGSVRTELNKDQGQRRSSHDAGRGRRRRGCVRAMDGRVTAQPA